MSYARFVSFVALFFLTSNSIGFSADIISIWDGENGNWSDSSRWDSTNFPNNGNGGFTYDAILGAGDVSLDLPVIIEDLAFSGGSIGGTDSLTLSTLNWTGGTFNGTGLVTVNGGTWGNNVYSSLTLDGTTLRLTGNVDWVGDYLTNGSTTGRIEVTNGVTFSRADGTPYGFGAGLNYDVYTDLAIESGGMFRHQDTGSTTLYGQVTNDGTFQVDNGSVSINSPISNYNSIDNSLNGGIFRIKNNAELVLVGAAVHVNRAEIILEGANSRFTDEFSQSLLSNLMSNESGAVLRLLSGRGLTISTMSNHGLLELGGGTFSASTFTNTGSGVVEGFGSIIPTLTNSGVVRAKGGALTFSNAVQGSGTIEAMAGATVRVSAGGVNSTASQLILRSIGSLNLGTRTMSVSNDFLNENSGIGNSFDHRNGIIGTGPINSSTAKTQTLSGEVSNGNSATPTIALGSIRLGVTGQDTSLATFHINNSSGGPSLRGAIKTNGSGATLASDSRFTLSGGPQNFGPITPGGQSDSLSISFSANTVGAASQTIAIVNNFDNVANQLATVTAAAYQPAIPTITPSPIALGDRHVGQLAVQSITIANNAPVSAFSENLAAAASASGTGVSVTGGPSVVVAPGASNSTIGASVNTSTAGAIIGTVDISRKSTGAPGLADLNMGNQAISVSANVYRLAQPSILNSQPLDFGIVHVGDVVPAIGVAVKNSATADGFSEKLNAQFGAVSPGIVTSGAGVTGLLPGATSTSGLNIKIDTGTARMINGSAAINLTSDGIGINTLGQTSLAAQNVAVTGIVNNYAKPVLSKTSGNGAFMATVPNTFTLDFGIIPLNGVGGLTNLSLLNDVLGPADSLAGSWSVVAGGFSLAGFNSFNSLAAGASQTGLQVGLSSSAAGAYTGSLVLSPRSENASGYSGSLSTITLIINAIVAHPADFNKDGRVDGLDLTKWRSDYGINGNSDADGDLDTDGADFLAWQRAYGTGVNTLAASQSIPEPSASELLPFFAMMWSVVNTRRRRIV